MDKKQRRYSIYSPQEHVWIAAWVVTMVVLAVIFVF